MCDDEFWNESQVKTSANLFTFDDKEGGGESFSLQMCGITLDGTAQLFQQVQAGLRQNEPENSNNAVDIKRTTQLELLQLIPEKSLNCLVDADSPQFTTSNNNLDPAEEVRILQRQLNELWVVPDPKKTVQKIMLKLPYVLELFHSLQSKKQLLQEAILLGDGDTILIVVIFLSRTLKDTHLNQMLLEMPIAAYHYVSYLSTRMRTAELTDLLGLLGNNKDASMKQFEVASQSPRQLQRLNVCAKNHVLEGKDAQILDTFIQFLEWQSESGVVEESVVDCLAVLCEKHWGESTEALSPLFFSQQQRISEKQYQWTAITVRAKLQSWQDIHSLLTAKSWLRRSRLQVWLPIEHVITKLHACGAPQDVLYSFLQLIDSEDKRLAVARVVHCDKAIVETSTSLKDK